ncbi:lipid A-modifier LpxR family protein, partial [Psychrobacter sp. CAL346-MNA-CIBAN-0220]|uniref:lipid A-modifier LpxR family protein n=1 Tax=Psychrobacter sp. CAL346-MNA-CIBAN-0220 TaxID=3140457 RepID=UPI003331ABAB
MRDEPVFQLLHERMRRHDLPPVPFARGSGLSQDMITHWGGALGNFGTHANLGTEWRIGWRLPDDFGSSPLRPAGEN